MSFGCDSAGGLCPVVGCRFARLKALNQELQTIYKHKRTHDNRLEIADEGDDFEKFGLLDGKSPDGPRPRDIRSKRNRKKPRDFKDESQHDYGAAHDFCSQEFRDPILSRGAQSTQQRHSLKLLPKRLRHHLTFPSDEDATQYVKGCSVASSPKRPDENQQASVRDYQLSGLGSHMVSTSGRDAAASQDDFLFDIQTKFNMSKVS